MLFGQRSERGRSDFRLHSRHGGRSSSFFSPPMPPYAQLQHDLVGGGGLPYALRIVLDHDLGTHSSWSGATFFFGWLVLIFRFYMVFIN